MVDMRVSILGLFMNEDRESFDGRWTAAYVLYLLFAISGPIQYFIPNNSPVALLFGIACGLSAALWAYLDSRQRRISIPHIALALIFFLWPIGLPTYFLYTRGFAGIRGILIHAFALILLSFISQFAAYVLAVNLN